MEIIQKLIEKLKVYQAKADELSKDRPEEAEYFIGKATAFADTITTAELLLQEQQSNSDIAPPLQQAPVKHQ